MLLDRSIREKTKQLKKLYLLRKCFDTSFVALISHYVLEFISPSYNPWFQITHFRFELRHFYKLCLNFKCMLKKSRLTSSYLTFFAAAICDAYKKHCCENVACYSGMQQFSIFLLRAFVNCSSSQQFPFAI